ncbi:MAG TPA: hypothetical protein VK473_07800 [Terriglobales bacterium]|nr:hypothetical protein [Terriglobales bacterium]
MSRTCLAILAYAAALVALGTMPELACQSQTDIPAITVMVYNRSPLSPGVIRAGQQTAAHILREAGVESLWVDCLAAGETFQQDCRKTPGPTRLVVTIVPRWPGPFADSDTLGLAAQNEGGAGAYCYVFAEKLQDLVRESRIDSSVLLGHAIAHELGHLLEGSHSHAAEGIMAARWDAVQINKASRGALRFTPRDQLIIQRRLSPASGSAPPAADLSGQNRRNDPR